MIIKQPGICPPLGEVEGFKLHYCNNNNYHYVFLKLTTFPGGGQHPGYLIIIISDFTD